MARDPRTVSKAISVLQRIRDGVPNPAEERGFDGDIGDEIKEIADEFMTVMTGVVAAVMDSVAEDVPERDAPITFQNRLSELLREMLAAGKMRRH